MDFLKYASISFVSIAVLLGSLSFLSGGYVWGSIQIAFAALVTVGLMLSKSGK
jgi:hypothetical protein